MWEFPWFDSPGQVFALEALQLALASTACRDAPGFICRNRPYNFHVGKVLNTLELAALDGTARVWRNAHPSIPGVALPGMKSPFCAPPRGLHAGGVSVSLHVDYSIRFTRDPSLNHFTSVNPVYT
jgi:hypothetical protein